MRRFSSKLLVVSVIVIVNPAPDVAGPASAVIDRSGPIVMAFVLVLFVSFDSATRPGPSAAAIIE